MESLLESWYGGLIVARLMSVSGLFASLSVAEILYDRILYVMFVRFVSDLNARSIAVTSEMSLPLIDLVATLHSKLE